MSPLAPVTDADKERLREQGKRALELLASRAPAIVVALLKGEYPAALALLLALAKEVGTVFGTRENAELALRELRATGILSKLQAGLLGWLVELREEPPPHIDPENPSTWWLGAPALFVGPDGTISLRQTPQDPQP